jgi:hypothetical protein
VNFFTVIYQPSEITWRESRIEKAMKSGRPLKRYAFQNFFYADYPLAVDFKSKVGADPRTGTVGANYVSGPHPARK